MAKRKKMTGEPSRTTNEWVEPRNTERLALKFELMIKRIKLSEAILPSELPCNFNISSQKRW